MQKEHFEVILEDINSKIDLVVEGHTSLNKKINDLDKKIDDVRNDMGREIQDFRNEVSESNRQNKEDHLALFQIIKTISTENKDLRKEFDKFRKENKTAHKEILGGIKLSYRELDSRMKFLEQEVSSLSQRVSLLEASRV